MNATDHFAPIGQTIEEYVPQTQFLQRFDIDLELMASERPVLADHIFEMFSAGDIEGVSANGRILVSCDDICEVIGAYETDQAVVLFTEI